MIAILQFLVSLGTLFFIFKMQRDTHDLAEESRKKDELAKKVAEFGAMFADVAGRTTGKKKVVSFTAKDDDAG
jgi:hypothetical protein